MNGSPGPRALLVDALGTLVELRPPAPRLRDELAARFGADVSLAEAQAAIATEIGYYRAHLNAGRDAESLAALRLRCAQALRDALPSLVRARLPEAGSLVDALLASLQFDPFPDALRALPRLRAGGRRLVVVSNWDVSLHEVLERVGIANGVDAVVTSAEVGARKPEAAIFERALALADASADQALHVGDSLTEDVEGARAAGIDAVLLRRDGGAGPAGVRTIASLEHLV